MYSRGTKQISYLKNEIQLIHSMKIWMVGELEVFWSDVKEWRLQNQEIEG
jgi:hypothetical protein